MPKTIISDTSCIILLDKIGELEILKKLFGTITTTLEIAEEFGQLSLPGLNFGNRKTEIINQ